MTIKYLQVPVGEYGTVKVEIEPTDDTGGFEDLGIDESKLATVGGFEDLGLGREVEKMAQLVTAEATNAFDKMLDDICAFACGFQERMGQLEKKVRPDEASVEFGLVLKAEAGVVVTAGGEGSFKVTLTWKATTRPQERK